MTAVIFFLLISLFVVLGLVGPATREAAVARELIKSKQAYFLAEAGMEDVIFRIFRAKNYSSQETLQLDGFFATTTIQELIGGEKIITSQGEAAGIERKIKAELVEGTEAAFHFGVQVGDGGLMMENNSIVNGNIFSNGSVSAQSGSRIEGTVKVAGTGNSISGATISGNAYVDTCDGSEIAGELNALSESGCSYGAFNSQSPPEALPLPIPQEDIDQWKQEAQNGGIIGTQSFSSGSRVMGPVKIEGDLTVDGSAILILDGTLWVTGNINIANNAQVQLSGSYGSLSGVIVADGVITIQNNSISSGSGSSGSYLMYLSTAAANPALIVKNNAIVDIVYTSNGWIQIENNAVLRQITGYGILVKNNAEITYEIGLADVDFTTGPGGSWEVTSWEEVE